MTTYVQDKQLTVLLSGEIDHHHARDIMQCVTRRIDEYLPKDCILDFREVTFMDSSGIAVVICALRRMRELDGKVKIKHISPQPEKVLRAAGVERIVEMEGSVV